MVRPTLKNDMIIIVALLLCSIIVLLTGQSGLITMHENSHQQIFLSEGINSTITYEDFFGYHISGITIPTKNGSELNDLAHNINEAVGYHITGLWQGIVLLAFMALIMGWLIMRFVSMGVIRCE